VGLSVRKFWEHKSLAEMTTEEWESLCDGCGLCCLKKLEDEATGEIEYTDVACRLLDLERCRCTRYAVRTELVADCVRLTPETIDAVGWLPATCAYRLVAEGRPLEWWHPLVSGDRGTVHRAGISLRGRALSERDVHPLEIEERVIHWVPFKRKATK
jgi:uncharacterized cysteine cluster protein YcgN (CxxCxxCC family)